MAKNFKDLAAPLYEDADSVKKIGEYKQAVEADSLHASWANSVANSESTRSSCPNVDFVATVTTDYPSAGLHSSLLQGRDHRWVVRLLMVTSSLVFFASSCGGSNAPARELAEERFSIADIEEVNGAVRVERQVSDGAINAVTNTGARIVQIYKVNESATAESVLDEVRAVAEADGWEIEGIDRPSVLEWESAVRVEGERTRDEAQGTV